MSVTKIASFTTNSSDSPRLVPLAAFELSGLKRDILLRSFPPKHSGHADDSCPTYC
jgi:hypothetical protein